MTTLADLLKNFDQERFQNKTKSTILVIDDDISVQRGLKRYFSLKYKVLSAGNAKEGLLLFSNEPVHCIILDIKMQGINGFDIYPKLKKVSSDIPIFFYTGFQSEHDLKTVLNKYQPAGFFAKGDNIEEIESAIDNAVDIYTRLLHDREKEQALLKNFETAEKEVQSLKKRVSFQYKFDSLKGNSIRMMEFKQLCDKAIHSDITVLIQGETGTGKELIANIIHTNSSRSGNPFIIQNCAAIPENLFESEFFGYKKGAFSGAVRDKKGIFEIADTGTVFLDEVSEMPLFMQAKLLRLIQEGEYRPLGDHGNRYADVRIIAATNMDLKERIKRGLFREDLYYRLGVFRLYPPPLREMMSDIPVLVQHFLRKYSRKNMSSEAAISQEALDCLMAYNFPGNVRELENEIERAVVMLGTDDRTIKPEHLSDYIKANARQKTIHPDIGKKSLKKMVISFEKEAILLSLKKQKGNKTRVANELGISRVGLNNKIKRYRLSYGRPDNSSLRNRQ